jgi:hypothetical protein
MVVWNISSLWQPRGTHTLASEQLLALVFAWHACPLLRVCSGMVLIREAERTSSATTICIWLKDGRNFVNKAEGWVAIPRLLVCVIKDACWVEARGK